MIAAARDGEIAAVCSALASGTEPDAHHPRDGTWALLVAADNGRAEIVEALLRAGANVNTRDNNGVTALMAAAKNGEAEIVQALIEAGADVNAKNKFGGIALMSATARGHAEIVRALLAAGANPNAQDNRGGTALSAALAVNQTGNRHDPARGRRTRTSPPPGALSTARPEFGRRLCFLFS